MRFRVLAGVLLAAAAAAASGAAQPRVNAGIVWADAGLGIFEATVEGEDVRRLASVADQHFDPAWSPSGEELVFSGRNSDTVDVHLIRARAGERKVLAFRGRWVSPARGRVFSYLLQAAWSPDGDAIAFSDWWTPESSTIRIASLPTRRLRSLTSPDARRSDSSPAWSPDGRTLAFVRQARGAKPVIVLTDPNGRTFRGLTHGVSPSWSPDGRRLVFAWGDAIYRIGADGRGRTRLARSLPARGVALQPRWSPDGRRILYLSLRGIWTMDVDGKDRRRVVRGPLLSGAGWRPG